jgi:hypothetical protein
MAAMAGASYTPRSPQNPRILDSLSDNCRGVEECGVEP